MVLKELPGDFKQVDNFHVNTWYNVSSLYIVYLYRALFSLTIYAVDMIQVLLGVIKFKALKVVGITCLGNHSL